MNQVLLFESENFRGEVNNSEIATLENQFSVCSDLDDLSRLLIEVNLELKNADLSIEETQQLKKLRSRIYTKKKTINLKEVSKPNYRKSNKKSEFQVEGTIEPPRLIFEEDHKEAANDRSDVGESRLDIGLELKKDTTEKGFLRGIFRALSQIDGEAFTKNLPKILLGLTMTGGAGWLLWSQSIQLYESSGFSNPELIALGGIAMAIGFALLHSIKKSWLTFFLCVYIGCYEVFFIASGTKIDETAQSKEIAEETHGISWKKQNVEKLKLEYESNKSRYDDPNSKVYKNGWFKKKYLDPSWKEYSKAQKQLLAANVVISESSNMNEIGWLKIFYRLGLVGLLMVSIHFVSFSDVLG